MLEEVPDRRERHFFVSGPPTVVGALKQMLTDEVGVAPERLLVEEFAGYD